jgi:hypothetical protein
MTSVINHTAYLRTTRDFNNDEISVVMNKAYIDIAAAVNSRTIGIFPTNKPAITGESWFVSSNQRQQTLRQIYNFGSIASGTELDIPHGITSFTNFTKIYATVTTNVVDYRPIPYIDPNTLTTGMTILVDSTNIRIVLGSTAPPVTSGIAVLEWLSNV